MNDYHADQRRRTDRQPIRNRRTRSASSSTPARCWRCRFDPSGQFVFATAYDNTIQRWHLASGKATPLAGHDSWVRTLAFHPSGSTLYSGGYDGRVIWWEATAEAPQPLRTIEAHQGWVRTVAVSPDGKLLATCGNDNLVKIWNAADGTPLGECHGHANHVYNVAFHPRRTTAGLGRSEGHRPRVGPGHGRTVAAVRRRRRCGSTTPALAPTSAACAASAFSADGKLLACGGITEVSNAFAGIGNPLVVVFDFETGEKKQSLVTASQSSRTGVRACAIIATGS